MIAIDKHCSKLKIWSDRTLNSAMKKIILIPSGIFFLNTIQGQIFHQLYGYDSDLHWNSITNISGPPDLIMVGNFGGQTWPSTSAPNGSFTSIAFISDDTGYVVNANGGFSLYGTYDGGLNWYNNVISGKNNAVTKITFINDSVEFTNDRYGYFDTQDKGITWNLHTWGNYLHSVDHQFIDQTTGYFVGNGTSIVTTFILDTSISHLGYADTSSCYTINLNSLDNDIIKNNISVFPNPTTDDFSINLGTQYENIVIIVKDIQGRIITAKEYMVSKLIDL
jgi:hypothetical protein